MSNLNKNKISYKDLKDELDNKFPDYDFGELAFDECFHLIYNNIDNVKDIIIISSFLRQIEPSIEVIKSIYSVDEEYINRLLWNKLPLLRILAYDKCDNQQNNEVVFFPGFHNDFKASYGELANRIEYFFEIKRNTKKLLLDTNIKSFIDSIKNNSSFLFLLNYLSVKDSLLLASSLNIIDIDEDKLYDTYSFNENFLENIFDRYIFEIKDELNKRIQYYESIEIETSYFDYRTLCNDYKDLMNRIDDTLDYLKSTNRKR